MIPNDQRKYQFHKHTSHSFCSQMSAHIWAPKTLPQMRETMSVIVLKEVFNINVHGQLPDNLYTARTQDRFGVLSVNIFS